MFTNTEVNAQISNSFKSGVLRLYGDDATERGLILHPTALHFAVHGFYQTAGAAIIMTMDQTAGVVINSALSVGGDFYAPNVYHKTQVDYIASTKQPTTTASSSFTANNLTAVGAITAAKLLYSWDG